MRVRKGYKRIVAYALCFCLAAGTCGCGWVAESEVGQQQTALTESDGADREEDFRLLPEAELDYQVPEQYPGVWVSLGGYDSKGSKEVYFCGRSLPETFRVMDAATGQCVYTGRLEEDRYDEETGEYNSYGEFTDFVDVGEYYIECDIIGRSYSFTLQEERLREQFDLTLTQIRQQGRETLSGAESVRAMLQQVILVLLSYELYPDLYEDGDGNQIPDVLEYTTEAVRAVVGRQESAESDDLAYELAAALAKYSYIYQKYDSRYATDIVQIAAGLWQRAEKTEDPGDEARLLAAAELYRATGQRKYVTALEASQGGLPDKAEQGELGRYDYLAAVTYLATKQKVKVDICDMLIRKLMNRGGQITEGIPHLAHRETDLSESAIEEMMWDMALLSAVNYVITNYEYGRMIESQHYFLWGCNARSYCFWEQDISQRPSWTACYLLMLCDMRVNE